jgi:hypothetical protein
MLLQPVSAAITAVTITERANMLFVKVASFVPFRPPCG